MKLPKNGYATTGIPFKPGDIVLMRRQGTPWVVCVYMGYEPNPISPEVFISGESWHDMIAPMAGNEDKIGTRLFAEDQIDRDSMEKMGLLFKE